ncbi:zinc-binding dehydrogenase [Dietzia psychralcaliphila]|uniref:zinc-binding dehydrogenase n=1 Tax=Dietzia psychralcaliphila TaxID=139021 RepID=UPI001330A12C|nr:zinc-binding dehydrogenase [Dietzia psychralcaliphila]
MSRRSSPRRTAVGSARRAEKVAYLTEVLGLDAAINWRDELDEPLSEFAPEGIDVYFDSVGGDHLKAALTHLCRLGRVALCGAIAGYNGQPPAAPDNLFNAISKGINLRGFLAGTFADRPPGAGLRTPILTTTRSSDYEGPADGGGHQQRAFGGRPRVGRGLPGAARARLEGWAQAGRRIWVPKSGTGSYSSRLRYVRRAFIA